eukprot:scaffold103242_cov22-Tisochrysis_lutea.AAC.1
MREHDRKVAAAIAAIECMSVNRKWLLPLQPSLLPLLLRPVGRPRIRPMHHLILSCNSSSKSSGMGQAAACVAQAREGE